MNEYIVYDAGRTVGRAKIVREGMFWRIQCACDLLPGEPCRIMAKWDNGSIMLGLCAFDGSKMSLLRRIPMNKLELKGLRFELAPGKENGILIDTTIPLTSLSDLKHAKLKMKNGSYYLVVSDSFNTRPTGQWSEPRISE